MTVNCIQMKTLTVISKITTNNRKEEYDSVKARFAQGLDTIVLRPDISFSGLNPCGSYFN